MDEEILVLHVDDDPDFVDVAAAFLEREDPRIAVKSATSAAEGLDALAAHDVDCVVSDHDMPGQNGIEFLRVVREDHTDLPFILYTGKGSEQVASDAITAGVTDYLQKEQGTDQYTVLANRIANAVESHRSRRALTERNRELRRYERMVDSMREAACIYDEDGRFEIVNDYLAEWYGTTAADLEGEPSVLVRHVRARADGDPYQALLDGERDQVTGELEAEFPDHGRAVLEYRLTPLTVDGTVEGVVGVTRDVTEQTDRERELRRNERRYRAIFDDPNILVGLLDPDGVVVDINQTAMEYVDARFDDVRGVPLWETPWFDHSAAVRDAVQGWVERAASGEYVEFDTDLVRPSGEPYSIEGVFRPVTDDDGEVVSLIVSDRDVTERKRRERELERTNALRSTLFDTLPQGVLAEDQSREVLAANRQLFELFEMEGSPEEAVGADCERLAETASELFADSDAFVERIDDLVAAQERVDSEELALADGRTFERTYRPIDLPDGGGHLWVYRDVTDRKDYERRLEALNRATQELLTAETRKDVAATSVRVAREILDLEATAVQLYDEETAGLEPVAATDAVAELVGDLPTFTEGDSIAWRAYERGEPLVVDDVHDDPDVHNPATAIQSEIYLPLGEHGILIAGSSTAAAFDQQDRLLGEILAGSIETALDQVERTQQLRTRERELIRQNDRLEQFASIVSHDLRNPLNVAEGRLALAAEDCDSEHLAAVEDAHERMRTLIEDLLALARDGDTVTDPEPVDLAALVDGCWATVDTRDAELVVDVDRTVLADESRLRQVFENLFRNAVEHGGDDVTVTVGELDDGFYVADDGPGIPDEDREVVFEAGYSTADAETGFGLSIVAEVVEAHDWTVRVTDADGGGSRFEITGVEFGS